MNESNVIRRFGKEINRLIDDENIITIKKDENNTMTAITIKITKMGLNGITCIFKMLV